MSKFGVGLRNSLRNMCRVKKNPVNVFFTTPICRRLPIVLGKQPHLYLRIPSAFKGAKYLLKAREEFSKAHQIYY